MTMENRYDIVIVGGGASGLAAAAEINRINKKLRVCILEKNSTPGRKIPATGNGRCNISNAVCSAEAYNKTGLMRIIPQSSEESDRIITDFFSSLGVCLREEEQGRKYPLSGSAQSVLDALLISLKNSSTVIETDSEVFRLYKENGLWSMETKQGKKYCCKKVIFAVGGYAAPQFGTDGKSWKMLRDLGIDIKYAQPALCPLIADEDIKDLRGIRLKAEKIVLEKLSDDKKRYMPVYEEKGGEIQFSENSLSGVCIMNASCFVRDPAVYRIKISVFESEENKLSKLLLNIKAIRQKASLDDYLTGLVNKKLGIYIIKKILPKYTIDESVSALTEGDIKKLAHELCCMTFNIKGRGSWKQAQTTSGGVTSPQISDNMEIRSQKGLFVCGEVCNVHGICGGYNLAWAWISAIRAAAGAAEKENAKDYLLRFDKSGKAVTDLSRIKRLLHSLGDPHRGMRFIHIAGTNAKGSVLEIISSALIKSGYKTGQFTSPFIRRSNDRIRINGIEIPDQKLGFYCTKIAENGITKDCSQFEIFLAAAFLYFRDEKCDIAVIEAGIGGLLDATNVIENPLVSVITTISYDHTAILGKTISEIAYQKAGIIKENSCAVVMPGQTKEAYDVIKKAAESKNSIIISPDESEYSFEKNLPGGVVFRRKDELFSMSMAGRHQMRNAETAICTLEYLKNKKGFSISKEAVHSAVENTRVEGRIQLLQREPINIYIDGGHNIEGAAALCSFLENSGAARPLTGVVGMMASKDYKQVCRLFDSIFDEIICADDFAPGCCTSEQLMQCFTKNKSSMTSENALKKLKMKKSGTGVICGSLYLVSYILNAADAEDK